MAMDPLTSILDVGSKLIDKLIPDPAQRDAAKLELVKQQQAGEFKELEERMGAITTEAGSADPWTSRARPAFMYVIYVLILSSIPMGFLTAFNPMFAGQVIAGFKGWLAAIPPDMLTLFGAGYLGYTVSRTGEKIKGVAK